MDPVQEWHIEPYTASCKQEWDYFVSASRNGTFLFRRDYMDYHADRFEDGSLMTYRGQKLRALLPAHWDGRRFCSHLGLTYGGVISDDKMTAQSMIELFGFIIRFIEERGAECWVYRPVPYIYTRYPSQEDLYALFRWNARLTERKISTVIPSSNAYPFSTLRCRKVHKAIQQEFTIFQDDYYAAFWKVLERNLWERHQAYPVHSLDEIILLHRRFPEQILLYRVCDKEKSTVAGCVMYLTSRVAHVQYIGSTAEGRKSGAVDYLFHHLIHDVYAGVDYFDMGTSVEEKGRVLNEGLIFQKEGFGGRAVVYDTYEINLKDETIK
ncbi:MAG: GNAT family N-acetyltransferase [Paraprevotella sp.]|nr:GNAT family N-acetyltransferase [Paraprevotella sp.]